MRAQPSPDPEWGPTLAPTVCGLRWCR